MIGLRGFLNDFLRNLPKLGIGLWRIHVAKPKFTIYKYVRTDAGWRYCRAAFHDKNGKIKPNIVIVASTEEKHVEGK